jgi:uncharacterized protein (DUF924 family)
MNDSPALNTSTDSDAQRIAQRSRVILDFWFGFPTVPLKEPGALWQSGEYVVPKEKSSKRYHSTPEFDDLIRQNFASDLEQVVSGGDQLVSKWTATIDGTVALITLLDQFSRNIYRNTPKAFTQDALAQRVVIDAVRANIHRQIAHPSLVAVLLHPFMHSESLELQNEGVRHFTELTEHTEKSDPSYEYVASLSDKFGPWHRDIIEKFGRFPHRNKILNRETTEEEKAYLEKHGGF